MYGVLCPMHPARGLSGRRSGLGHGLTPGDPVRLSPAGAQDPTLPRYSRARAGSAGQGAVAFPPVSVSSFPAARLPFL